MTTTPRVTDFSIAAILATDESRGNIVHQQSPGRLFPCDTCKKTFTASLYLKRHQMCCGPRVIVAVDKIPTDMTSLGRVCDGRTVYHCPFCRYQTTYSGNIRIHLVTHSGERPYKCDVCGKCFTQIGNLTRHHRVHTGDKPYKCTECSYSGNDITSLKRHVLAKHTDERVYGCSECSYRAVYSSDITTHTRLHTGEKPYHCHHCDYRASQKHDLTSHVASKHNKQ